MVTFFVIGVPIIGQVAAGGVFQLLLPEDSKEIITSCRLYLDGIFIKTKVC
jgi:hypothetical protein